MINELLEKIGLNSKETEVYLTLLKFGNLPASRLVKLTRINRTTIYSVVKNLKSKGLVTEDLASPVALLVGLPPENLLLKLEEDQAKLDKQKELAKRVVSELEKVPGSKGFIEPKISYVPDYDIERYIYARTDIWDKSLKKTDSTMWGFQDSIFEKRFRDYIFWYWKRPLANGMKLRFISDNPNFSKEFKNPSTERQIRYWENGIDFTSTVWVYGEYLCFLNLKEKPNYLIEIYEPLLAENMRLFFKTLWQTFPDLKK